MSSPLYNLRHSLAHLLAQAVLRHLDPHAVLGTGPAIDDGCYYDIGLSADVHFGEGDFSSLTKWIQGIAKEQQSFVSYTTTDMDEALAICDLMSQPLKKELIAKFHANGETSYSFRANSVNAQMKPRIASQANETYVVRQDALTQYFVSKNVIWHDSRLTFVDLCEGGHVENTKDIADGCFAIAKVGAAYRQNSEENQSLTRIYMNAFETKDELKSYQTMMEEARKRDHRILGDKLKIFTISQLVGAWLPLFQPNGSIIRQELEKFLRELHKDRGYQRVWTPHLAKEALYECSGHAGHYMDDMFKVKWGSSGEDFYVKPMNCPHHMQIFADNQFSYRDMPVRYFEPATVYRDEKSGQLSGLTRVRCITQDDGHLFCRIPQIHEEVAIIVQIIKEFYAVMGMLDGYKVRLSIRGDDHSNYLGSDEVRNTAEEALRAVCDAENLPYEEGKDEAAFYGPKLDFMFKDAIGRPRQLATVQLDFNLPQRFDLSFVNEQWEKERPVVIHRAISGSLERFIGVAIENFAGAFPVWMAPTQAIIVPVADVFNDYAYTVQSQLKSRDLRVKVDTSDDSFSKKIRNAELMKIPYILIVGEKEQVSDTVAVREFRSKAQYEMPSSELLEKIAQERDSRSL